MKKIILYSVMVLAVLPFVFPHLSFAAADALVPDKGDTAWMLISTVLVALMTIPGIALFYGGLVRSKNMLSILMQSFSIFCLAMVLWVLYGYSIAFTEGNAFFGGLSKIMLKGVGIDSVAGTFSKGVVIPELVYVFFQATFSAITPALIVGAFAERMKFSAIMLFTIIWYTFAYLPAAHMTWFWAGPDAYTDALAAAKATASAGFLFQKGAIDFAGGTVVHINAAIAGLIGAYMCGKRVGYGKESMAPHSLTMTMIGASLLWIGWFGFNAGSNLEANGLTALAFGNTMIATAAAGLMWMLVEWMVKKKPSLLGTVSGAVGGLVAITPACGWIGIGGAMVLGLISGVACFWGVTGLKKMLGVDDALDVFGIHGVGGILGSLLTGILANPALGGMGIFDYASGQVLPYSTSSQLISQLWGVCLTIVWSGAISFLAYKVIDVTIGLRVSVDEERRGLDTSSHGESAYHF